MKLGFVAITPGDGRELLPWLVAVAPHVDAVILREPTVSALALQTYIHAVQDGGSLAIVHSKSARVSGDGVHVADGEAIPTAGLVGVSCHDAHGLDRAFDAGATYALLSPVWAPTSKPLVGEVLGLRRFHHLAQGRRVLGLGGVDAQGAYALAHLGYGCAVLGAVFHAAGPLHAALAAKKIAAAGAE